MVRGRLQKRVRDVLQGGHGHEIEPLIIKSRKGGRAERKEGGLAVRKAMDCVLLGSLHKQCRFYRGCRNDQKPILRSIGQCSSFLFQSEFSKG